MFPAFDASPLVSAIQEMEVARKVQAETGIRLEVPIGTMTEVPRGVLTAGAIAGSDTR